MVARSAAGALLALFVGLASFGCARHHYALTPVLSWTEAEAYANSLGGHLVAINSQAEQDLLVSLFGGTEPFWIGLNREADGAFVWSNGDPLTYTNWLPGEPSNSGGLEHYGEMNWRAPGKWNDATNTPPGRGIVELTSGPPAGGVLAASLALAGLILAVVVRVRRRLGESGK